MYCSLEDRICHVKLKDCQAKGKKLKVVADKISVAPKSMTCEHLELECNSSMVVESILLCHYISLKSNKEVRLSASASLKTETLKILAKTVFIDGHVKYQEHFHKSAKNVSNVNCKIFSIHINGNLHIGRDSVIRCGSQGNKSKSITGTLQLHVNGDICNHGTIEASNLIEVEGGSLLSCHQCYKDTSSRYLSSIKQKNGMNEYDNLLPSNIHLGDAVKRLDTKLIFMMLKHGFDPYSPLENKGASLTSTAKKLQWTKFCPQEKYDNEYSNSKLQVDNFVSLIEAWNKQRGSIISPEISSKLHGDFDDFSQVKCKKIFLKIRGNICVENESICTVGCISGICKGHTRIHGQMKLGSFESFETNDFSIYDTGTLIIQNGGNISVDNRFYNKSLVYNLNNTLRIYTGVFQQENESQITSQEALEIDICKESQILNGSLDARDLRLYISARVTETAVIKSINSCTIEFKENTNKKECAHLNHKGSIEVCNGHVLVSSAANVYDKVVSDLTVEGQIISVGLLGSSAFIDMKSGSNITLRKSDSQTQSHQSKGCESSLIFATGNLSTAKGSEIKFCIDKIQTRVAIKCRHLWKHYGLIKVEQEEYATHDSSIYVGCLQNHGYYEGFDCLNISVDTLLDSHKPISAHSSLIIQGKGDVYNRTGGILQCARGHLRIQDVRVLQNDLRASIYGKTIEIATSLGRDTTVVISKKTRYKEQW